MAKYTWNNPELKKKAKQYDWWSVIWLVVAVFMFMIVNIKIIAMLSLVIAIAFQVYSYKFKREDKNLKKVN